MIKFDEKDCLGCGLCVELCIANAFISSPNYSVIFDRHKCLNCEVCNVAINCCGECITQEDDNG